MASLLLAMLAFFTATVAAYGIEHGVHGLAVGDMAPTSPVFIAVVPVLLYSFVGIELPSAAAEEMVDPRRDIPAAIARAGACQAVMYAVPILAVLTVLPTDRITSLHGLIDAMQTVFTVYGGAAGVVGGLSAALTVSIALIVLAYLFVFPAFIALRLRRPELERPSRVPGGTPVAWAVSIMATGWSLLAALCLLWPGLGSGEQDAALPAGFEGERLQFELLVLAPVVLVVALAGVFYVLGRATARAGSES